jgi:hypothetical protein
MNEWQGKPTSSEKTFPSATLSTADLTWLERGSKSDRRCRKPATNSQCYGMALVVGCSYTHYFLLKNWI